MTRERMSCVLLTVSDLTAVAARSDTACFTLEDVTLAGGTRMRGVFSWTFPPGDFENGSGQFVSLDIPYTTHDHTDLEANIDATQSIEITLPGSVHDDGVDITLVLASPLTPTTSSVLVLGEGESKYEIGGNGFHTGLFQGGSISPTRVVLTIADAAPGHVELSWQPDIPGSLLQERTSLASDTWTNSPSGAANPVSLSATAREMYFRLVKP